MAKNFSFAVCLLCCLCSFSYAQQGNPVRDVIRKTYEANIGVRERSGRNDGAEVEVFLKYVWLKPGQPWCAAFVSWTMGQAGIRSARSGGCVKLMEQGRTIFRATDKALSATQIPQYGDVFFIWFAEKKRVAHTGFIHQWGETTIITVEGNTNEAGSREGDGVYRKRRLKRQIYAVTTYIK